MQVDDKITSRLSLRYDSLTETVKEIEHIKADNITLAIRISGVTDNLDELAIKFTVAMEEWVRKNIKGNYHWYTEYSEGEDND